MTPNQPFEHSNSTSQSEIDKEISNLQCWDATLPFDHVEGIVGQLDLFNYTDRSHKPPTKRSKEVPEQFPVIFDRERYPPTKDGLNKLNNDLIAAASTHEELQNRHNKLRLNCFRCRCYNRSKKKSKTVSL